MFNVTPETQPLLSLLIMVASFLIAQIITTTAAAPTKVEKVGAAKVATTH